jgi:hypothetical protein
MQVYKNQQNSSQTRTKRDLTSIATDFISFIRSYKPYFKTATGCVINKAEQYLCGLMEAEKKIWNVWQK